jgi:hypothetical protein
VWTELGRTVGTVSSIDLLGCLLERHKISSDEYRAAKHKLRTSGYYAVPIDERELLEQIDRASASEGGLVETAELRAIRESISIGRRGRSMSKTKRHGC